MTANDDSLGEEPPRLHPPGVRWVVCHNAAEATRDKTSRDEAIARLHAELPVGWRQAWRRPASRRTDLAGGRCRAASGPWRRAISDWQVGAASARAVREADVAAYHRTEGPRRQGSDLS
jgi:hypothetical protein